MSTTDLLNRWSALSLEEIQEELDAGQNMLAAQQLFGADEVAAMRADDAPRRAGGAREAVVLLPGLMGSLLASVRGVITSLWLNPGLMLKGQSRFLELNQDGTADASPNILTVATGAEKLCYLKPALALNRECLLFEFPYDWRRPIQFNADRLGEALERWADDDPHMQFTLVGHSMGGLVSRAFVARHSEQAKRRVKRVIMHGTPHFGAAGAIADLMEGNRMMALASALNENNSIRRFVLNMPSAYQLAARAARSLPQRPALPGQLRRLRRAPVAAGGGAPGLSGRGPALPRAAGRLRPPGRDDPDRRLPYGDQGGRGVGLRRARAPQPADHHPAAKGPTQATPRCRSTRPCCLARRCTTSRRCIATCRATTRSSRPPST